MAGGREFGKLLDGVVVAISGLENPERAEVRDKALAMGAQYRPDWTPDCTLLLAVFPKTPKVRKVKEDNGTIVHKDWIHECYSERQLRPMDSFLMHSGRPWVHRTTGGAQQPRAQPAGPAAPAAGGAEGEGGRGGGGEGGGEGGPSSKKRRLVVPKSAEEEGEEVEGFRFYHEVGRGRRGGGILAAGQRERERERERGREREREREQEASGQGGRGARAVSRDGDRAQPGGAASQLLAEASLANVEETEARQDVLRNLEYLRQQAQKPPEDEMLSVAVEGLLACFEDTLEVAKGALEKGSSVLQDTVEAAVGALESGNSPSQAVVEELGRWPVVPHPLRPLTRVNAQPGRSGSFHKGARSGSGVSPTGRGAPLPHSQHVGEGVTERGMGEGVEAMGQSLARYTEAVRKAEGELSGGVSPSGEPSANREDPTGQEAQAKGDGEASLAEAHQGRKQAPEGAQTQQQDMPKDTHAQLHVSPGNGNCSRGSGPVPMRPCGSHKAEEGVPEAEGGVPGVDEARVRRDVEENVAFLRSQEDKSQEEAVRLLRAWFPQNTFAKPPESDLLRVAVEGLQVCFEDALVAAQSSSDEGAAENALKEVLKEWPVVPYPLRRLADRRGPWGQALLEELRGLKEEYCKAAGRVMSSCGKGGEEKGDDAAPQQGHGVPLLPNGKGVEVDESADTDSLEGDGELLDVSSYRQGR